MEGNSDPKVPTESDPQPSSVMVPKKLSLALKPVSTESPQSLSAPSPGPPIPQPAKDRKYTLADFALIKTLGEGSFGEVLLASDIQTEKRYAIKRFYKKNLFAANKYFETMMEKMLLQYFELPFMPKFIASFQDPENFYMVLEHVPNGDLIRLVSTYGSLTPDELRFVAAELVVILESLQRNGILHRDIKPQNILLDEHFHLKLIDYGSAALLPVKGVNENIYETYLNLKEKHHPKYDIRKSPDKKIKGFRHEIDYQAVHRSSLEPMGGERDRLEKLHTFVGTASYIPPEFMSPDPIKDYGCDIWSTAITLYRLATGEFPYPTEVEFETIEAIKEGKLVFKKDLDPVFLDFIQAMTRKNPKDRLGGGGPGSENSIADLRAHPFLKGVAWDLLAVDPSPLLKSPTTSSKDSWGRADTLFDKLESLQRKLIHEGEAAIVSDDGAEKPVYMELYSDGSIRLSEREDRSKGTDIRMTVDTYAESVTDDTFSFKWKHGTRTVRVDPSEKYLWINGINAIAGTLGPYSPLMLNSSSSSLVDSVSPNPPDNNFGFDNREDSQDSDNLEKLTESDG